MEYLQLLHDVTIWTKGLRTIHYLVDTPFFRDVWKRATDEEQKKAIEAIKSCKKEAVLTWVYSQPSLSYADMPWSLLTATAQMRSVKYYSRMSRVEMVSILEEMDNVKKSKEAGNTPCIAGGTTGSAS